MIMIGGKGGGGRRKQNNENANNFLPFHLKFKNNSLQYSLQKRKANLISISVTRNKYGYHKNTNY